MCCAN